MNMSGEKLVGVLTVIHRTGSYSVEDFGPPSEIEAIKAEIHKVAGNSWLTLLAKSGPNKGKQIPVPIDPLSKLTKSLHTHIMNPMYLTLVIGNHLMLSLHHRLFAEVYDLVENRT